MDYARIYREFISDRLAKQPEAPTYFERHHILPRALGGGNESENLIRLTPEDHLFAHLLLAKIHGGHMWAAALLMTGTRARGKVTPTRVLRAAFGLARRGVGDANRGKDGLKGADNGNYNPAVYKWRHLDTGERKTATLHEMWAEHGGNRGMWTSAVTAGSGKPSAMGWAPDDGRRKIRSGKGQIFNFVNRDGRTYTGTQDGFVKLTALSVATASRVVRKESVTACGWRLSSTKDRHHATRKATGSYGNLGMGRVYQVSKSGKTFSGTVSVVAKKLGCTRAQFSAAANQIKAGRVSAYKGWHVQWQEVLFWG